MWTWRRISRGPRLLPQNWAAESEFRDRPLLGFPESNPFAPVGAEETPVRRPVSRLSNQVQSMAHVWKYNSFDGYRRWLNLPRRLCCNLKV